MKYILNMWKHIFDYKGKAEQKEYFIPLVVHIVLGLLALGCAIGGFVTLQSGSSVARTILVVIADILTLYLVVSVLPWISLTVRRLHDTGKSGWWAWLLLALGVGTIVIMIFCSVGVSVASFAGPVFDPYYNEEPAIYGPPEMFDDYDPSENIEEDIYGPADMFNESNDTEDEYDVYENMEPTIYGPPDMMN